MNEFIKKHRTAISVFIILILTIPIVLPFFNSGFFVSHDGEWTVVRLADMYRTIRDGQIPARYSSYLNMQYGYPLFNFAYPAPYYLGLIPLLLKAGLVTSIKIIFVGMTFLSGLGMFFLGKALWKHNLAGIVAAILFLYLPYRMVDIYVRGSLGEITALAVVPFLFLAYYFLISKPSLFFSAVSSLLLGLLLLSHNIQSLLFFPVLLVFIALLLYRTKNKPIKEVVLSLVVGLGLSAFFVIPALIEKRHILLATIPIADRSLYFVTLQQLVIPSWGYGVPTDTTNPFTYQIGVAQLLGLVVLVFSFFQLYKSNAKKGSIELYVALSFVSMIVMAVLMLFSFSAPVWKILPLLSEINYPWTLLGPIGFLISLVIGFLAVQKKPYQIVALVLAFLSILFVLPYAKPGEIIDRGDDYYLTNMATTTSSLEYTPLWVREFPLQSFSQKIEATQSAVIEQVVTRSNKTTFQITTETEIPVTINTIYYPGWEVSIDDKSVPVSYMNDKGVMQIQVPQGKHQVRVLFTETPVRLFANALTAISFAVVTCWLIFGIVRSKPWKK